MADKAANANCMNIKVIVNKRTQRILYAEAGKDFVDLLFSFLLLPSGTVINVLSDTEVSKSVGCITNVYDSVEKLPSVCMEGDKSELLQPKIERGSASNMLPIQYSTAVSTYYVCPNHAPRTGYCSSGPCYNRIYKSEGQHRVSPQSGQTCSCGQRMETEVKLVTPPASEGFVKETVTYVITDDLVIKPCSTISSIELLDKLRVNDLTELEERNLTVGFDEALHLLRASVASKSALNDVFGDRLKLRSLIKQLAKRSAWE